MGIWYCTREDVMSAPDSKLSAAMAARIDRGIEASSRRIESERICGVPFYPSVATRTYPYPDRERPTPWRYWLDWPLLSATTVVSGGVTIDAADYFLEPANYGPPYTRIEIDKSSNATLATGDTDQRALSITGVWGYTNATRTGGILAAAITTTGATSCLLSDPTLVGVGDLILVDSEYMQVTEKSMVDTGQDLGADLDDSAATTGVTVGSGAAFHSGELIQVGSEMMQVVSIAGNVLTVERGTQGTVLASHTAADDVYSPRTATIVRGMCGTTAATHLISTPILVHDVPGNIRQLCVVMSLAGLWLDTTMGGGSAGSGGSSRKADLAQLDALIDGVRGEYARLKIGAV